MSVSTIATDIKRPFIVSFINKTGAFLKSIGFKLISLDQEKLLQKAKKNTGLNDYGDDDFREGLGILLASLDTEADLNTLGRVMAYKQVLNLLQNRLLIIDTLKKHPEIEDIAITKPLVIAGLPRTGTTILQGLLSADPASRFLRFWEGSQPCPPKSGADKRIDDCKKEMDILCEFIPGFQAIHSVGAELPQECITLMAINFTSVQFELNFNIPSYQDWYFKQDLRKTFAFHKKCLQLLQYYQPGEHWVLKTPPYLGAMEPLLDVYPDARILQTHRDPAKVMVSVSSLYYALHALGCDSVTPAMIGALEVKTWAKHLEIGMQSRDNLVDKAAQIYDVYFDDLLDAPVAEIKKIYDYFGMSWSDELEGILDQFMSDNTREKHGKHAYTAEMFGLDEEDLDRAFRAYRERFNISKNNR